MPMSDESDKAPAKPLWDRVHTDETIRPTRDITEFTRLYLTDPEPRVPSPDGHRWTPEEAKELARRDADEILRDRVNRHILATFGEIHTWTWKVGDREETIKKGERVYVDNGYSGEVDYVSFEDQQQVRIHLINCLYMPSPHATEGTPAPDAWIIPSNIVG